VKAGLQPFATNHPHLENYFNQKRALSPNRHLAISGALNDFSLTLARFVVEEEHAGRLIYAGGDDVLAMLPVMDLLSAMQRLRHAYSGHDPEHEPGGNDGLLLHRGFARLRGRLMRLMGEKATASIGAVIAHHQAPLGAVLRELRGAESRAKKEGGRDAFSITIIKRSGGALYLTEKWGESVALLGALRDFLAHEDVSRRAVYHTLEWLNDKSLPVPTGDGHLLQTLLAYQFDRQAGKDAKKQAPELARRLTRLTLGWKENQRIDKLRNFLSVAEFLARETRTGGDE
jgi:CRISPR-associated protein Cmr2